MGYPFYRYKIRSASSVARPTERRARCPNTSTGGSVRAVFRSLCEEAKMIEEAVDMWSGFEIIDLKKSEQALTCAPMEVAAVDGGYGITEQCTVMGAPDVVLRRLTHRNTSNEVTITLDGKDKSYGRC